MKHTTNDPAKRAEHIANREEGFDQEWLDNFYQIRKELCFTEEPQEEE
ncbi:hypothetical protein LCGC14_1368360 [marine sediment metagenome]|uniref:Uncharacterized protein n=1 Tax=marine sediment metagenome TaxID=412755 RepID=A0A0F9KS17_9ZZZZ